MVRTLAALAEDSHDDSKPSVTAVQGIQHSLWPSLATDTHVTETSMWVKHTCTYNLKNGFFFCLFF